MDASKYTYPSPLKGFEDREPLPEGKNEDGKSYQNPQHGILSPAYEKFTDGLDNGRRGGFDVHVYFYQNNESQTKFAEELWKRIRYEFPELRIYRIWPHPLGPHTVAMFEVNIFTPAQFGAFIPWLIINRGPLSALLHPNTVASEGLGIEQIDEEERNHTQRATWLGERVPLDLGVFGRLREKVSKEPDQGK